MTPDRLRRREILAASRLLVLLGSTPRTRTVEGLLAVGADALAGGARLFELRWKDRSREAMLEAARRLAALCHTCGALLLVNDDPLAARESGADGVHVGQEDATPSEARRIVGPDLLVGLSVHDDAEARGARAACDAGLLDYVGVGTVFPSATKPDLRARGLAGLAGVIATMASCPTYGIGGVTAGHAAALRAAGFHGACVGSAIEGAPDVAGAVRAVLERLEGSGRADS